MFERQAARTPHAPAAYLDDQRITYRELDEAANRFAHILIQKGVVREDCVAVFLERSLEMLPVILGALKAGCAFLPLDVGYPPARLALMRDDANPRVVVTTRALLERSPFSPATALLIDEAAETISRAPSSKPPIQTTANNLAYIVFTSGTTGRPKGILTEHRGLCNVIKASHRLFGVSPALRLLQFASPGFDVAVWEIFIALTSGGSLHLFNAPSAMIPLLLHGWLRQRRITMAMLPASLLSLLPGDGLPELETVVAVGEKCRAGAVARWSPGRRLFNCYGPAEASITATCFLCGVDGGSLPTGDPPIGTPLDNVTVHLLDDDLRPVEVGRPGDLFVGGAGVARGYLNRDPLTREKFISNPLPGQTGRIYRTGDRARFREDGQLEFLGRDDSQVKIHGVRIEVQEVESVLLTYPGIAQAAVTLREKAGLGPHLAAFIVPEPGAPMPDFDHLRSFVLGKLPPAMAPRTVVALKRLPVTSHGKLDREALRICQSQ